MVGFFCEDHEAELHYRQRDINRAYGCSYRDLGDMLLISRVGYDNILMKFGRDRAGELTSVFKELLEIVKHFGAEFVVVDTAEGKSDGYLRHPAQTAAARQTWLLR